MGKLLVLRNSTEIMQRIVDDMEKEFTKGAGEVRYPINDEDSKYKVMITIELRDLPSVSSIHEFGDGLNYHLLYEEEDDG